MNQEIDLNEVLQAVASLAGEHFVQQAIDRAARMKLEKALQDKGVNADGDSPSLSMVKASPEGS